MFLQIYSKEERYIDILKGLENVVFAGGPLAPVTGDYLVACGVRLKQVYGLTEVGLPIKMNLETGFEDWAWHHFEEQAAGDDQPHIRWAPLGDSGTSELQILVSSEFQILLIFVLTNEKSYFRLNSSLKNVDNQEMETSC